MSLFWRSLSKKLDQERPGWRQNTLWAMDGAAYHQGEESLTVLEQLDVKILMQGPHSYDVAPCELYFARWKTKNINPRMLPSSKTHFDTVLELVIKRKLNL